MTVNRDYLNRELKIRYTQYLDRIEREGAFNSTSRSSINEAADRVRCWICMDKSVVWDKRGWGASLDSRGTHDLFRCGGCQNGLDNHKWATCCNWDRIAGAMYCNKNDNATSDEYAAQRIMILKERSG